MGQAPSKLARRERGLEPTWEVAHLFPAQGTWTEGDYLALETNHLVELSNGCLEVLPMPTTAHQMILAHLYGALLAFVTAHDLGTVLFAGLPVRLWRGKLREPDVVFLRKKHMGQIRKRYWKGADLVMEVVSGSRKDRRRDLVEKRREYARAGIPEYWIVDPLKAKITVLRLSGEAYSVHGDFGKGQTAASHLLPGFTVDVSAALSGKVLPVHPGGKGRRPKGPS